MSRRAPTSVPETSVDHIDDMFATAGLKRSPRQQPTKRAKAAHSHGASRRVMQANGRVRILRIPEWDPYRWLVHGFSTRAGGVSTVYRPGCRTGDLNLGHTSQDAAGNVSRNREMFLKALLEPYLAHKSESPKQPELTFLRQIHSGLVHRAGRLGVDEAPASGDETLRGDGMLSDEPGRLVAIQTADCIPVLIVDVRQRVVGAFHAGWRGTVARIVERGAGSMRAEFGSRPEDLTAAIGPGIGSCCYAVGEDLRMEFRSQFAYADSLFEEVFDLDPIKQKYPMLFLTARAPGHSNLGPSIHLDLVEANRRQLLDAGVRREKIHTLRVCTACDTRQFFSYRAEQGFTGRMVSVAGVIDG